MSGTNLPLSIEQIFHDLPNLAEFYLDKDLDEISKEKINSDLMYLQKIRRFRSTDRYLKRVQGLIAKIIPHFYRSRGFATRDVPRDLEYYSNMEEARNCWLQIRAVIRVRSSKLSDPGTTKLL
jgi:hypothetical protein